MKVCIKQFLSKIFSLYQMSALSADQIENFEAATSYYGNQLRRPDKLNTSMTINAHLFESHCVLLLKQ